MTQCFKAAVVERSSDYGAYERLEAKHSQDSEHEPKHKESSERVWDVVVVEPTHGSHRCGLWRQDVITLSATASAHETTKNTDTLHSRPNYNRHAMQARV